MEKGYNSPRSSEKAEREASHAGTSLYFDCRNVTYDEEKDKIARPLNMRSAILLFSCLHSDTPRSPRSSSVLMQRHDAARRG